MHSKNKVHEQSGEQEHSARAMADQSLFGIAGQAMGVPSSLDPNTIALAKTNTNQMKPALSKPSVATGTNFLVAAAAGIFPGLFQSVASTNPSE